MFSFFSRNKNTPTEVDKIFSFLSSTTHHPDTIENYLSQYNKLKRKYKNDDEIFINLYLNWEEFIINNKTENYKNYSKDSLRAAIKKEIDISKLSEAFRLIFLPKREQIISLYEVFILNIANYISHHLGHTTLIKTVQDLKDPLLAKIRITSNSLDFSILNKALQDATMYPLDEITKSFKNLLGALYNKIELSLGEKLTKDNFGKMFTEFKEKYNADLSTSVLKIVPDRILSMNEWLSMMSKKELEKQVLERTEELAKLNESLEQTVGQRTNELKLAYEDLKKLDEKKSEFISIAAHQLRTPLSAIKWGLTMLHNEEIGKLTKEQKDFLEKNIASNNKVIELVNDLLDIDLYTKDEKNYTFVLSDIVEIISNTLETVNSLSIKRNIKVNWNPPKEKIQAEIDSKKISVVIQNLVSNAIKYGNSDSEIEIKLKVINNLIQISVTNEGIGIPEEDQAEIFQRFFRAKNAIRKENEGMGIGLFISKNIVEDHGGRIWFNSQKDGKTTFFLELPIRRRI